MSDRIRRWRWRLARRIAPEPIIASPGEADGVYLVIRESGVTIYKRAETFRLHVSTTLEPLDERARAAYPWSPGYLRPRQRGRFAGTTAE